MGLNMSKINIIICGFNLDLRVIIRPSSLTLKLGLKSLHTLYQKALFMLSMSRIRLRGDKIYSNFFKQSDMTLTLDLEKQFNFTAILLTLDTL